MDRANPAVNGSGSAAYPLATETPVCVVVSVPLLNPSACIELAVVKALTVIATLLTIANQYHPGVNDCEITIDAYVADVPLIVPASSSNAPGVPGVLVLSR